MTLVRKARIGIWDSYQGQANPLVIEDTDEWRELTVDDLIDIFTSANSAKSNLIQGEEVKEVLGS